jgi:hypothetical protein
MKYYKIIGLITASIVLTGCINNVPITTKPIVSDAVFSEAKRLAADRMRDPEATKFKPEYKAFETNKGDTIVCGTLNGKNAMGGYVGYKPFYMRIRSGVALIFNLPGEDDDYGYQANSVIQKCDEASTGSMKISN